MRTFLVPVLLSLAIAGSHAQKLSDNRPYPAFAVGPSGVVATIDGGEVKVASIVKDTPAAAADLKAGDVLVSAEELPLAVADPRVPLGQAIGRAEAEDGALEFVRRRGDSSAKVTVKLPPLGAYRVSWPKDCPKSRSLIGATATFVAKAQNEAGSYQFGTGRPVGYNLQGCMATLFLLSTGDDRYLPNVERFVRPLAKLAETRKNAGGHINWQLGYQGILLGEYYLRTGDRSVLPGLEELCRWCVDNQAAGGWGHGAPVGPGYVQSGLMNHTTVPILIALTLARECGVKVDEAAYARGLKLIYRMTGHGCVAYGDHRSELWWSNTNGRNAMAACALSLLSEPRYQRGAEHMAQLVTDSYHQPEFGHTGGGFNVMWRGIASVHVPDEGVANYRRQMKELAWYYDLCRQPGGGFSMLPTPPDNSRYSGLDWGTGAIGLTYTAPLRTLRITGGKPTRFSVEPASPAFRWGTNEDLVFFSTTHAEGFGDEDISPREIHSRLIGENKAVAEPAFCAKYLRHYSPLVRSWAARRLGEINSPEAHQVLAAAITHDDPRVRRAVFDAVSGYDNWSRPFRRGLGAEVVTRLFLPAILKTLNNPEAAWWEVDGALFALGRAEPDDIRRQLPLIDKFARHEDWYLREGAFWAIVGLRGTITGEEFNLLTGIYRDSKHVFARSSYDAGFRALLKSDKVALERVHLQEAIQRLGRTTHKPGVALGYGQGGVHEAAHRTMMILKHFDPAVYGLMTDDFVSYLKVWEPYYQHSVWLITGSKWQPGILKVVVGLGPEAKPVVAALREVLARYHQFDPRRLRGDAKELEQAITEAIQAWEAAHGKAD